MWPTRIRIRYLTLGTHLGLALPAALARIGSVLPDRLVTVLLRIPHDGMIYSGLCYPVIAACSGESRINSAPSCRKVALKVSSFLDAFVGFWLAFTGLSFVRGVLRSHQLATIELPM